jgi:hypothetical protein
MKTESSVRRSAASSRKWLAAATGAAALALVSPAARADEPWPPPNPPRVDLTPAGAAEPAPSPSPAVVEPLPAAEPAEPAAPLPPEPSPSRAAAPTSADETLVRVATPPREPGQLTYGSKDGQLFLRTAHEELVLLPSLRLDMDGLASSQFSTHRSDNQVVFSRARVDAAGWVLSKVFFDLSMDFVTGPSLRHVDNYVAVAPWGDRIILQLGQFDAPFTLENRTSDRYLDFVHRGPAVRAFAIPENKDQGVMVHGTNPDRNFYYSAAVLNGAGPTVTGVDDKLDVMARAWIAPFSFHDPDGLRGITVGGSAWTGDRSHGPVLASQTTEGGHVALDPSVYWVPPPSDLVVREQGRLRAFALELDAPFAHRFGVRFEWTTKHQPLSAFDVTTPGRDMLVAGLTLSGWSTYGEAWAWVLGDNRMLGVPAEAGLQLPLRYSDLERTSRKHGVMLAARIDYVDERMTPGPSAVRNGLGVSADGDTKLTSLMFGATYWFTRRARLNLNYVYNRIGGTTPYALGLESRTDWEVLVRTSLAL